MSRKTYQHQRLRVPRGWADQEKALIIQLEQLLDDIYERIGRNRTDIDSLLAAQDEDVGNNEEP